MKLRRRDDGWWEIVNADVGQVVSAWPDRETACKIARLYGFGFDGWRLTQPLRRQNTARTMRA